MLSRQRSSRGSILTRRPNPARCCPRFFRTGFFIPRNKAHAIARPLFYPSPGDDGSAAGRKPKPNSEAQQRLRPRVAQTERPRSSRSAPLPRANCPFGPLPLILSERESVSMQRQSIGPIFNIYCLDASRDVSGLAIPISTGAREKWQSSHITVSQFTYLISREISGVLRQPRITMNAWLGKNPHCVRTLATPRCHPPGEPVAVPRRG